MRQNCDKYLKNAKISLFFLATLFIVVILKEIGFFKQFLDTNIEVYLMLWIVFSTIIGMVLLVPYTNCLFKK